MATILVVLCLLGVSVSSVLGQELAIDPSSNPTTSAARAFDGSYEDLRQGRIVAAQSRKTITTITTSVTSVPTTCFTAFSTAACRRKRRSTFLSSDRKIKHAFVRGVEENPESGALDSSLGSDLQVREDGSSDKEGKLAYTVWWSTSSTYTVTSYANNGITVSVSYFCSVAGGSYPDMCR